MTDRRALLLILAALPVAAPAYAQQAPLDGFEAYVERARAEWQVPGVAVAVVRNDSVVYMNGFGVRQSGSPERVDGNTIFALGSSSKAITAAALGMLVDDGLVRWDDAVIDHMPDFRLYDPYMTREVTIRDLLAHRTGVGQAGLLWTGSGFSRQEIVHRLRFQEETRGLRARFGYNNEITSWRDSSSPQ